MKKKTSSLLYKYPEIAKEWHSTKNGDLKPENVTAYSSSLVWWLGKCGHEWQAKISNRTKNNSGCKYCAGKDVLKGFNDLESFFPKLAKQWNNEKNEKLLPSQVTRYSNKNVWWIDKLGHEWQARISDRTKKDTGCPYCSNVKLLKGFNDLKTKYPEIADEWHPTKNGDLKPDDVLAGSERYAWWLGKCGHEWRTQICNRTISKHQCIYCSGKKILKGFNDLKTKYPEIAEEWHPTKNGNIKPDDVGANSKYEAWWLGKCGHEWQARISNRTNRTSGCPKCNTNRIFKKYNDLLTVKPNLIKYWAYDENNIVGLNPENVSPLTEKEAWWFCDKCNKVYPMAINSFVEKMERGINPCLHCNGKGFKKIYHY